MKKKTNEKQNNVNPEEIIIEHNVEVEELKKQSKEYFELAQRAMADFDNYKKRTIKEKEMIYAEAVDSIISKFLPILDSLDTAVRYINNNADIKAIEEGVEMARRKFSETLNNIGIEEIKAVGEKFDPKYHYAVSHIESSEHGDNVIIEELQRGYLINDKVVRHSMVKVAN